MNMALEKVESKVSLNIKISSELDARLKRARAEARKQGMKYNVSQEVEKFLLKDLKKVEKTLSIEQDVNEAESQMDLLDAGSHLPELKGDWVEDPEIKEKVFVTDDIPTFTSKKVESDK